MAVKEYNQSLKIKKQKLLVWCSTKVKWLNNSKSESHRQQSVKEFGEKSCSVLLCIENVMFSKLFCPLCLHSNNADYIVLINNGN